MQGFLLEPPPGMCVLEWYHGVTRASMRNLPDNVGDLSVNFSPLLSCRSGSKRVEEEGQDSPGGQFKIFQV